MPYHIEILSVGENSNSRIAEVAQALNVTQTEFQFSLPPERLKNEGLIFVRQEYQTVKIFEFLGRLSQQCQGQQTLSAGGIERKA